MDIKKASIEELECRLLENREFFIITPVVEERRKLIKEDHEIFLEIDRRLNGAQAQALKKQQPTKQKSKYVRYKEGAALYSMCLSKFEEVAKQAQAVYKVGGVCLVNTEIFEKHLELYRLDDIPQLKGW